MTQRPTSFIWLCLFTRHFVQQQQNVLAETRGIENKHKSETKSSAFAKNGIRQNDNRVQRWDRNNTQRTEREGGGVQKEFISPA